MKFDRGYLLKQMRLNAGYTLDNVGHKIGISKQTLYKYENNIVTNIPSDKIEALAELYNISPAVIMGWDIFAPPEHEINIEEAIKKAYGETTKDAVKLFTQLDILDQGQTIGTMKLLLDAPKYKKEKSGA